MDYKSSNVWDTRWNVAIGLKGHDLGNNLTLGLLYERDIRIQFHHCVEGYNFELELELAVA